MQCLFSVCHVPLPGSCAASALASSGLCIWRPYNSAPDVSSISTDRKMQGRSWSQEIQAVLLKTKVWTQKLIHMLQVTMLVCLTCSLEWEKQLT